MYINNLSATQSRSLGRILPAAPEDRGIAARKTIRSGAAVPECCSDEPVILDYVSGMTLLVLYEGTSYGLYYLDRVFELTPGIHFSVITLDDSSQYDLYTRSADAVRIVAEHPANQFQNISGDIKVHRLLTFLFHECARDFYFRGEQHEAFELVCVDRGELHNLVGGTDILLHQQQLMLIDRNVWHVQYADLPVSFLTISFRADAFPCSSLAGRALNLTAKQTGLVRQMLSEYDAPEYAYDCVESLLRLLLIDLLRSEKKRTEMPAKRLPSTSTTEQRIADQLVQTILSNAGRKLTLPQLADSAHISMTYMHRVFRTQLGMTPGKYLTKIRIEESKVLLREGSLSMGEIAKRLGFSNQQHFSRQFHAVAGMTPTEYVRTLR